MSDHEFPRGAACRPGSGVDPELFFPFAHPNSLAYLAQVDDAVKVCDVCPVRAACLAFAIDLGATDGVFGGQSAEQRRGDVRVPATRRVHTFTARPCPNGRAVAWSERPRGRCPVCHIRHPLRVNGTLIRHDVRHRGECVGTGATVAA